MDNGFWHGLALVVGLTAATLFTRNAFLFSRRPMVLPARLKVALRYAPAAALAGVVAPELLLPTPLGLPWLKIAAALVAAGYFFARRGILGTIVAGMAAYWVLMALSAWID